MAFGSCKCCGGGLYYTTGYEANPPERCYTCETRGGVCLHNMAEHLGAFHYSVPHGPVASQPETCQWCLGRLVTR